MSLLFGHKSVLIGVSETVEVTKEPETALLILSKHGHLNEYSS